MSRRVAALVLAVLLVGACSSGGGDDEVDVGFLRDMADHHEQAVRMALLVLGKDDVSPITRAFATDVIASQRYELGLIDGFLDFERGAPDRDVMTWMDMSSSLAAMPGMATQASLDSLASASGRAADDLFLALMVEHHEGGLHMAEYADEHGDDERVRELAQRIIRSQTKEIAEMAQAQAQLGPSPLPDEFVFRAPMPALPTDVVPCTANDIELNRGGTMGLGFLMFFNRRGEPCGLADHPALQGQGEDGAWHDIPTVRSPGSSYTDGPEWTGSFEPTLTAVLSIRPQVECDRPGAAQSFSALRILLAGQGDAITVTDAPVDLGGCAPRVLLWAYDSTDM